MPPPAHVSKINCQGITRRELQPEKMGSPDGYDEPSKAAGPADEGDNPFNDPQGESADQDIPF